MERVIRLRKKLKFTLEHRPRDRFTVGTIYRFKWADMYRALQIVGREVQDEELGVKMNSLLGSTKEMIHTHLFEVLQALEYDEAVNSDRVRCAGWIIACYGYIKSLPTLNQEGSSTTWPHPAPLKKLKRRTQYSTYRDNLKCPLCGKMFIPPKRYKNKTAIVKWFGIYLHAHIAKDKH